MPTIPTRCSATSSAAICIAAHGGRSGIAPGSEGGGVVSGSGAAFLVLEIARACRKARRAGSMRGSPASLRAMRGVIADGFADADRRAVPGGRSGSARASWRSPARPARMRRPRPSARRWTQGRALAVRAFSTLTGHLKEAQFPFAIALAALAIRLAVPILHSTRRRKANSPASRKRCWQRAVGYHRYEGAALVTSRLARRSGTSWHKTTDHLGRPIVAVTGIGIVTSLGVGKTGQLGGPDLRPLGHPRDHPLSHRPSQYAHRRHRRLPEIEQQGRHRPHLRAGRNRGTRGDGGGRPADDDFGGPLFLASPPVELELEEALRALCFERRGRRISAAAVGGARPQHAATISRPRSSAHRRLAVGAARRARPADHAVDRVRLGRDRDPARRRGDPARRMRAAPSRSAPTARRPRKR